MKHPRVTKIVTENSVDKKYKIKVGKFTIIVTNKEVLAIEIGDLSVYIDNSTNERLVYTQIITN